MRGSSKNILFAPRQKTGLKEPSLIKKIEKDGIIEYRKILGGVLHREDGPAREEIRADIYSSYFIDNSEYEGQPVKVLLKQYYINGKLHCENAPAFIKIDTDRAGNIITEEYNYYQQDKLHRMDGPAQILEDHLEEVFNENYYQNGYLQSLEDKPSSLTFIKNELSVAMWHKKNKVHRNKGPAFVSPTTLHWKQKGRLYNPFKGPAFAEFKDGTWHFGYFKYNEPVLDKATSLYHGLSLPTREKELQRKLKELRDFSVEDKYREILGTSEATLDKANKLAAVHK